MIKCVIYSRVSTTEQDTLSQIEDLQKYAKNNKLNVIETFKENVSGYDLTKERQEYDLMKEFVLNNDIKYILIWELSRLGRSTLQTLKEIDFFTKKGINIFFKKENLNTISDNPTNNLLLNLLSSVAELERNTIVERTRRGKIASAERGTRIGYAFIPYGYEVGDKKMLKVNDKEAKVVKEIYALAEKGTTVRGIANYLNSKKIATRYASLGKMRTLRTGKVVEILWQNASVQKMLKSTIYKGERNFIGNINVIVPAIIDKEQWEKVQQRFKGHIGYLNRTKYDYLFKTKIFCGSCGRAYITRTENRYPSKPSYYICSGRVDPGIKCKAGQFTSKVIDEMIYDLLFRHTKVISKVYKDKKSNFDVETKKKQIDFYRSEIMNREGKKAKVIYLYKEGLISESELKKDLSTIKNDISDRENKIRQIERELNVFTNINLSETLNTLLQTNDFNVKYEFVQKYVDKIMIYNVRDNQIDFTGKNQVLMKTQEFKPLSNPTRRDKLVYLEVFAFGSQNPIKVVLSGYSKICFTSSKLEFKNETLTLQETKNKPRTLILSP